VSAEQPDYREIARKVARALSRRDPAPLLATLAAGRVVETRFVWEDLSDGENPPEPRLEILGDEAAVRKYVASHGIIMGEDHGLRAGTVAGCKGNCCTMKHESCMVEHRIEKLCFWPLSATEAVPVLVDVLGCET
jgi:hypothetical protein